MREDLGVTETDTTEDGIPLMVNGRVLSAQDITALREARDRRAAGFGATAEPPETGGVDRPSPTRYGDWEKNGRAIDFS